MNKVTVAMVVGLSGIVLALSGCQVECTSGKEYQSQQQWELAVDSYEACLAESQMHNTAAFRANIEVLKRKISDNTLARASQLVGSAKTLQQFQNAVEALTEKEKYDDNSQRIAGRKRKYAQSIAQLTVEVGELHETARKLMNEQKWGGAIEYVDKALAIDEGSHELTTERSKIITARNNHYKRKIDEACSAEDYVTAKSLLAQFDAERPAPSAGVYGSLDKNVTEMMERVVREKAESYKYEEKYLTADALISETHVTQCEDLHEEIRSLGSEFYKNQAYKHKANVSNFRAYISAVKAVMLAPDDNEIFELHRDSADIVDESIRVRIGIAAFDSPTNNPDIGKEFADSLISYLTKKVPYGVKVSNREKLEFALIERGVRGEAVMLLGMESAVFGNVSTLVANPPTVTEREKTIVITGVDENPNPQFQDMIRQYGSDRANWPLDVPAVLKTDTFHTVKYRLGEGSMEGMMVVSAQLYSATEQENIDSETFEKVFKLKDAFQDEVQGAGVVDDPLEFEMSELEMKQSMRRELVDQLANWTLASFAPRQKMFYDKAMEAQSRREDDVVIQFLAQGYLYSQKDSERIGSDDEYAAKIRQLALYDLTE